MNLYFLHTINVNFITHTLLHLLLCFFDLKRAFVLMYYAFLFSTSLVLYSILTRFYARFDHLAKSMLLVTVLGSSSLS